MKIELNKNFANLSENYLFSEIARRVNAIKNESRGEKSEKVFGERIISLGIGDVSLPVPPSVAREMARASTEMGTASGFRGYGDTQGDPSLREAICRRYAERGIHFCADEIFINDGAKCDLGNLNDVLGDNEALIIAPAYPVYLDASIISGRRVRFLEATRENGFLPTPDGLDNLARVIYLCSPNNPTGAVFDRIGLQKWVDHALESGSLIIFDAAYESFISSPELPHSIFELEGAKRCAVEVCSFSKMAGFTGLRCGWTALARENPLHTLWKRRQGAKFNGASYIAQRGAIAAIEGLGQRECAQNIAYYMENARILADFFKKKGIFFTGGVHAPYLWVECPRGTSSWELFDRILSSARVVCTPGSGFGKAGEGFVRLSSFAAREDVNEAILRLDRTPWR